MKHWFPKEVVKHKRGKIAEIIRDLAAKQNPDKKFQFPPMDFIGMGSGYTDDEDEDEFDGADSDDLESAIPPKEVRPPNVDPSKGKLSSGAIKKYIKINSKFLFE